MSVCKYNQQGFCKYREQCVKEHVSEICPEYPSCKNQDCVRRHPRVYRTFVCVNQCKFTKCAYSHQQNINYLEIENLKKEVSELKVNVTMLFAANEQLKLKILNCNNISEKSKDKTRNSVSDLKERIITLSRTCDELKLEIKDMTNSTIENKHEKGMKRSY